ncbi:MAG: POTRA domain-containing protein [Pseudomonadota bacterium]
MDLAVSDRDSGSCCALRDRLFAFAKFFVALFTIILGASEVVAQDAPGLIDPGRQLREETDRAPTSRASPPSVVAPQTEQSPVEDNGLRFTLAALKLEGNSIISDATLSPLYAEYLNTEIGLQEISNVAAAIERAYRGQGYILTRVVAPEGQSIDPSAATIRLRIVEGFIDKIVYDAQTANDNQLRKVKKIVEKIPYACRKGDVQAVGASCPLHIDTIERHLLLANDLPGISVEAVLLKSDIVGAASLRITVLKDQFNAQISADNRSSRLTGPIRTKAAVSISALTSMLEQTTVRGAIAEDPSELYYIVANERIPIGSNGLTVDVSGSYLASQPDLAAAGDRDNGEAMVSDTLPGALFVDAESYQVSVSASYPLIRSRRRNLFVNGRFEVLDSTVEAFSADRSTLVLDTEDKLRVLRAGLTYDFAEPSGAVTIISAQVSQGLDILDATESTPALVGGIGNRGSRAEASGEFTKISLVARRQQDLTFYGQGLQDKIGRLDVVLNISGQYAFDNLLAPEEFALGGENLGRGYDPAEITGDHGIAGEIEFRLARRVRSLDLNLQPYVFLSTGKVFDRATSVSGTTSRTLGSVGGGMRAVFDDQFSGFVEIAAPTNRDISAIGNNRARFIFGVSANF